jgi:hypothetical protein
MPPGAIMMAVRRRRVTRRATLSGLATVGLTGLTRRTDAAPPLVFGVVIPNNSAQFYKRLQQGMREEAASLGVELRIEEYMFDPKEEVERIDQFVIAKVDGILVVPLGFSDPVALRRALLHVLRSQPALSRALPPWSRRCCDEPQRLINRPEPLPKIRMAQTRRFR